MRRAAPIIAIALAAPAMATSDARLVEMLKGRTAGPETRCIRPENAVQPVIIDGKAIVYPVTGTLFVGHLAQACSELREDRRITTRGAGGQLCRNDPVYIRDSTGRTGFGFCTFSGFTPYKKSR
jgi:hypothetical protein